MIRVDRKLNSTDVLDALIDLFILRGTNTDRTMAGSLQHRQAAQRIGLLFTTPGKRRAGRPETNDTLTNRPDHPMRARHPEMRFVESKCETQQTRADE